MDRQATEEEEEEEVKVNEVLIVPEKEDALEDGGRKRNEEVAMQKSLQRLVSDSPSAQETALKKSDKRRSSRISKDEKFTLIRVIDEIIRLLEGFSLMKSKAATIRELLRILKDVVKTDTSSMNVVEVESLVFEMLNRVRCLRHHSSVEGFLVAFSSLDTERHRINDCLRRVALVAGYQSNEAFEILTMHDRNMTDDKADDKADSLAFRAILEDLTKGDGFAAKEEVKKVAKDLFDALVASDAKGDDADTLGILDIGRHNIFQVCSFLKQLLTFANKVLDTNIDMGLSENMVHEIDAKKITIGGFVFYCGESDGKKVLSLKPFSPQNKPLSALSSFESLQPHKRAGIREELERWKNLSHPSILSVYGVSFEGDMTTFVVGSSDMSLFDLLYKEDTNLEPKQMETMIRGIARGLDYLHDQNIVHKHLCPSNIFLNHDFGVKIAGFGVCWIEHSGRANIQRLFPYLPPEAIFGQAKWTTRSDVYSFGILAWEITHGKRPFSEKSYGEVVDLVTTLHVRPPFEKSSGIPAPWFEDLISKCWSRKIASRPTAKIVLDIVLKNTKNSVRMSQRIMKGMLSFIPRREHEGPRAPIATLASKGATRDDIQGALKKLVSQAAKEYANAKGNDGGEWYFERFWNFGGAECVIKAMRDYPEDIPIQTSGCQLIRVVGRSRFEPYFTDRQMSLTKDGGGVAVLNALKSLGPTNTVLAEHGCGALKSLSSTSANVESTLERRQRLSDAGVVSSILSMMEAHPGELNIQINACGALKNLTFFQGAIKSEELSESLRLILRAMKKHPSKNLARHVTGVLMNCSFEEENQSDMVSSKVGPVLIKALLDYPDVAEIQSACFLTLWNLCFCDEDLASFLMENKIDDIVLQALKLHPKDQNLISNAFCLVDNLAWFESNRVKLEDKNFSELLKAKLLEHPESEEIWESGIGALKSLSWGEKSSPFNDKQLNVFFNEQIFGKFLLNKEVIRNSVLLLQNLTCQQKNLKRLFEKGMHDRIILAMKTHSGDPITQEASCGALCNLATPQEHKVPIYQAGAVVELQKSMRKHPNNITLQKNGCCALLRLARSETVHDAMAEANFNLVAGLVKAATLRFPQILDLPDLADVDEVFPLADAYLENCSICLEPLCYDEIDAAFNCEHNLHIRCVSKWIRIRSTCPLCRASKKSSFIPADDVSEIDNVYEEDEALLQGFLVDHPETDDEDEDEDEDEDDDEDEDEAGYGGEADDEAGTSNSENVPEGLNMIPIPPSGQLTVLEDIQRRAEDLGVSVIFVENGAGLTQPELLDDGSQELADSEPNPRRSLFRSIMNTLSDSSQGLASSETRTRRSLIRSLVNTISGALNESPNGIERNAEETLPEETSPSRRNSIPTAVTSSNQAATVAENQAGETEQNRRNSLPVTNSTQSENRVEETEQNTRDSA